MLRTASILFCDWCEASTARFERAWLAYVERESDTERHLMIVCPGCAERNFGEDEAAGSN
jgi:hypothetical protein